MSDNKIHVSQQRLFTVSGGVPAVNFMFTNNTGSYNGSTISSSGQFIPGSNVGPISIKVRDTDLPSAKEEVYSFDLFSCSGSETFHLPTNQCYASSIDCSASIPNSVSSQTFNSGTGTYNACTVQSCNSGFRNESNECLKQVDINITSNTLNANLFALGGSQTVKSSVVVNISSGVKIYSTSAANASLDTGTWPAGTKITINNSGNIVGKGGDGGDSTEWSGTPTPGTAGGHAILARLPLSINNIGLIGGGGGGGGGAGGAAEHNGNYCMRGGSGGGGAGNTVGVPGIVHTGCHHRGAVGSNGTELLGGNGGAGVSDGVRTTGSGGKGGDLGQNGSAGGQAVGGPTTGYGKYRPAGAAGGVAGRAIFTNGHVMTWISGYNTTQVKGAVN